MVKIKNIKTNIECVLSPLEADILRAIWPNKTMRVREVYNKLKKKKKVALSSVAVLLDRLYEKKVVDRKIETARGGLRYLYFPIKTKMQFEKSIVESTVDKLIERFGSTAVSYFNERFKEK